jgi:peptide/nickel transport system permease protein
MSIDEQTATAALAEAEQHRDGGGTATAYRLPPTRRWWRRGWGVPVICGTIVVVAVAAAILAPLLAPYDPNANALTAQLAPPAWQGAGTHAHLLGTDELGRDILSRLLYGARISVFVGAGGVVFAAVVGVTLGLVAGYARGWLDRIFVTVADIQLAFPFLVLAVVIVAASGTSVAHVLVVLTLSGWVLFARVVRADVLRLRESEFVLAGRALGARSGRLMFSTILPNVMPSVIVMATFTFAQLVMLEASLSFLGVGMPPSIPTWGGMIQDGRQDLSFAWWESGVPAIALILMVLAVNLLGDWLRDRLDPRLKL